MLILLIITTIIVSIIAVIRTYQHIKYYFERREIIKMIEEVLKEELDQVEKEKGSEDE